MASAARHSAAVVPLTITIDGKKLAEGDDIGALLSREVEQVSLVTIYVLEAA